MPKLFVPQATLESWALEDVADIKDGRLLVKAEKASFPVIPAVHFLEVVSGQDERKLLSKVKTEQQVKELGGEQLADSVLIGEAAYQVAPGYIAEVPSAPAKAPEKLKPSSEADLLAAFLLNKI